MNIDEGFQIEVPEVFVRWGISEADLRGLLDAYGLRHVTHGYYTLSCVSLGGMSHELGFHFFPRHNGILRELEFFRRSYDNLKASFDEFQSHFEAFFGEPTREQMGSEGFPSYTWEWKDVRIIHYVIERFGLEEHMRIQKA
ncbi:MAG TPA: hypothetical protein VF791_01265 [Pyrinomonadaceae bacterium]